MQITGKMRTVSIRMVHVQRAVVVIGFVVIIFWFLRPPAVKIFDIHKGTGENFNLEEYKMNKNSNEAYKSSGSLQFRKGQFILDGRPFRILSGAIHYFRVVPEYWKDRLLKMKAGGLNTIETYVAWNLHEEFPGHLNFDGMLDIRKFIQLAKEVGVYVILRPGPYICSEWDFGGMPAWLLADPTMKVRSNYQGYMQAVSHFFSKLLPLVVDLQRSKGGPIIAFQVENEFGSYSTEVEHLMFLKKELVSNGVTELFLTSDGWSGTHGDEIGGLVAPFHQHALPTVNFQDFSKGLKLFDFVKNASTDFPLMVMEFWAGWFDHWGQSHKGLPLQNLTLNLENILKAGASVSFYMYHGGTNFGFMAGANQFDDSPYKPDTTSYDYDAALSEAGDLTPKYHKIREILLDYVHRPSGLTSLPDPPPDLPKASYGKVQIEKCLEWEDLLSSIRSVDLPYMLPMEMLHINDEFGQNYGYILYRKMIGRGEELSFQSDPSDRIQTFLNGKPVAVYDWKTANSKMVLPKDVVKNENVLDILVENHGRVNYVRKGSQLFNRQRKGLTGDLLLDGQILKNWKIYPLEFNKAFLHSIMASYAWQPSCSDTVMPAVYQTKLTVNGQPKDTFLNMEGWEKGIVFVNDFNLGRYWKIGPQQTLYIPAPLLKSGDNQIVIFEQHSSGKEIMFQDTHILSS